MLTISPKLRGTRTVSRSTLHSIPVPRKLPQWEKNKPGYTFWEPIQHGLLADMVLQSVEAQGLIVVGEQWTLSMDDMGLVGAVEIEPTDIGDWLEGIDTFNSFQAEGLAMFIMIRHSNNAKWALHFLAGAKVLVCANGMTVSKFGAIKVTRKHSKYLPLEDQVFEGVTKVCTQFDQISKTKQELQGVSLTNEEGNSLLVEAYHKNVMPWSTLSRAADQWKEPNFDEFRPRNGWSLYNALTFAAKARNPSDQIETISKSSSLILDYADRREAVLLR